jgi:hypothetical protein
MKIILGVGKPKLNFFLRESLKIKNTDNTSSALPIKKNWLGQQSDIHPP